MYFETHNKFQFLFKHLTDEYANTNSNNSLNKK